ncbi:unnamed protein product [Urochloa humidicola]
MAACQGVAGGEQEYFQEKRNLEDLWLSAFPIGTKWENIEKIKEFNWNFQNLEVKMCKIQFSHPREQHA